jgi:hypothetical protein
MNCALRSVSDRWISTRQNSGQGRTCTKCGLSAMDFFPVLRGCTAEFSRQPHPREVDLISVGLTPDEN